MKKKNIKNFNHLILVDLDILKMGNLKKNVWMKTYRITPTDIIYNNNYYIIIYISVVTPQCKSASHGFQNLGYTLTTQHNIIFKCMIKINFVCFPKF